MKNLPIGRQNFREIIEENLLYVDKTKQIHQLLTTGKLYFLSRPRRFGKTLLFSTIRHIFQGEKDLFKGLYIHDKTDWDWKPYPILTFNFSSFGYKIEDLEKKLKHKLAEYATIYNIQFLTDNIEGQFAQLIKEVATKKAEVVILVDEYDKPMVDFLTERNKATKNQKILKRFFSPLKGLGEEGYLKFLFITGVSQFTKVSLFSDLNFLTDLTISTQSADIAGITHQELITYFSDRITDVAQHLNLTEAELIEGLKYWYDGYSWDGKTFVYNPFSLLLFFREKIFGNYWFATGTPTFLVEKLRRDKIKPQTLDTVIINHAFFNKFDFESLDIYSFLFQTGYLTIKKVDFNFRKRKTIYTLSYPNVEVQESFSNHLLEAYSFKVAGIVGGVLTRIGEALENNDLKVFIEQLQILFSDISYHLHPKGKNEANLAEELKNFRAWEGYFQSMIYLAVSAANVSIKNEVTKHKGRIDAVVETDDYLYIMEYKLEGKIEEALEQIKNRAYVSSYKNSSKTIVLVGIVFDKKDKNIKEWDSEIWQNA